MTLNVTAGGTTRTRTTTYAVCPHCGEDAGTIDHLLGQTFQTAWYCDHCGYRYALAFSDGGVIVSKTKGRKIVTADLLVLRPQDKPIYFVVKGMRFEGEAFSVGGDSNPDEEREHKQFFYESHSCPINWLKPDVVYFDGDADPHGVIEFVDYLDDASLPHDESYGPNDRDHALTSFIEQHQVTECGEKKE